MCGIAGIVSKDLEPALLCSRVETMRDRLRHRGPDDEGLWFSEKNRAALAHTRLAILDLSPAGHQPMLSQDGRYVIVFNGEIYNFNEIRDSLASNGVSFRSSGDTEVILEAYRAYGTSCVQKLVGMFAFAIWDTVEETLFLARGPFGIKPLYVWLNGRSIAFASEVRSLLQASLAKATLCPKALHQYLLYGSVQEPRTLVQGIESLPEGHWMRWKDGQCEVQRYYTHSFAASSPKVTANEAIPAIRNAFLQSVHRHFVSDVPVSIFLSGGVDSSSVLAAAIALGHKSIQTFSISFDEKDFNEGDVAAKTAAHFNVQHVDRRLTANDGVAMAQAFLDSLDQPSIDGFNTYCVSKLARDHGAKVVLSGLGGDELFGGYPSFQKIPALRRYHRLTGTMGSTLRTWMGNKIQQRAISDSLRRAGAYLCSDGGTEAAYWTMRGIFTPAEADRITSYYVGNTNVQHEDSPFPDESSNAFREPDMISHLETTRYMQNQLLRDSDVMSMVHGLELRVPFVDRELLASVRQVPAGIRLSPGKRLLTDAMHELPPWVIGAPKRGFSFPFARWFESRWQIPTIRSEHATEVKLTSWYRRWCLVTLEHFLHSNRIDHDQFRLVASEKTVR